MLKKAILAILSLAAAGFALAGEMSSCVPARLTIPCESPGWDVGAQALYFKPTYSVGEGYEYTTRGVFDDAAKWGWGYRIEGSYHFNMGSDLVLNWSHFEVEPRRNGYAGLTPYSGPIAVPFSLTLDNKFDQVNLLLGQQVDIGLMKNAHFYGGLQYAKMRVDQTNNYSAVPSAIAAVATGLSQYRNSDFNGFGPVVGVDYSYKLPYGFSLTANTAGSILYGTTRYNSGFVFAPSGLVQTSVYASMKSIVPSLEAKLGLNYIYDFLQGILNLDAGFQAINYFHALETRGATGFSIAVDSNFGLFGPYFGLKWVGNI